MPRVLTAWLVNLTSLGDDKTPAHPPRDPYRPGSRRGKTRPQRAMLVLCVIDGRQWVERGSGDGDIIALWERRVKLPGNRRQMRKIISVGFRPATDAESYVRCGTA